MTSKSKSVPPHPVPRLYLTTPIIDDPTILAAQLPELLGGTNIAAVLVRLAQTNERTMTEQAKILAPAIQQADIAFLLEGHFNLVARVDADGAHVTGVNAMNNALPMLRPDRIIGVGGLTTRHDAMVAGEAGADYVLFGEPDSDGRRPSAEAIMERLQWWAELFEPPCIGFAATLDEAGAFATAGADFILVSDFIWSDPRGPRAALMDARDAIELRRLKL